jgi:hypothetical protein
MTATIRRIRDVLSQLHPGYSDLNVYFRTITAIAVVVFMILSIFQPFNLNERNINGDPILTAAVYAGWAFLTMLLNTLWIVLFPKLFAPENWTLKREFGIIMYQMLSIAGSVWLLNIYRGVMLPGQTSYLRTLGMVFSTGILPYMVITFIRHNYMLRKHLAKAQELNDRLTDIPDADEGQKHLVIPKIIPPVPPESFYFAESRGNNLHIFCRLNGEAAEYKVRSTISEFERDNSDVEALFHCHRSFIINLEKVTRVEGNAAGLRVLLHPSLPCITVSRTWVGAFYEALEKQKAGYSISTTRR